MFFNKKETLPKAEKKKIVLAIRKAEQNTSGEIRVHLDLECNGGDPYLRAIEVFQEKEMFKTAARNGVLVYVSLEDKVFSIIGDKGINEAVPANFWNEIVAEMKIKFSQNLLTEGIIEAVLSAGKQLEKYFPYQGKLDKNELSDEISEG